MVLTWSSNRLSPYLAPIQMIRKLRLVGWFIIGFAIISLPMLAYAAPTTDIHVDATAGANVTMRACTTAYGGLGWEARPDPPEGVCSGYAGVSFYSGGSNGMCRTGNFSLGCFLTAPVSTPTYTCPSGQNWTLTGSSCDRPACASGETRDTATGLCQAACPLYSERINGVCVCQTPYQMNASNQCTHCLNGYAGRRGQSYSGSGEIPSTLCIEGCTYDYQGIGVGMGSGSTATWNLEAGKSTGVLCTGSGTNPVPTDTKPIEAPETKCVNQGKGHGTVNGVVICLEPSQTVEKKINTVEQKNAQGAVTSNSTSNTTNSITNNGGSTTIKSVVTNPDGSTTTTTTTGGKGNGEGEGDDAGTPPEEGPITEQSSTIQSIDVVSITTDMNCPQDLELPHSWGSFSYQPACDLAGLIRPLTLLFAWLSAGFFVVSAVKVG